MSDLNTIILQARLTPSIERRFWEKVDKLSYPHGCWLWTGCRDRAGYGRISTTHGRASLRTHRVAWEITHGPIIEGRHILHHCDNPPCCNPQHLFCGTAFDNAMDRETKGRGRNYLKGRPGMLNGSAKLTTQQAYMVHMRRLAGEDSLNLAMEFNISRTQVRNIASGKAWRNLPNE